jgi:F-type H+-transporting ATPase subunit b
MGSSYWTILLQAINFLVLIWLLQHFLYRPVLGVIESRRAISARAMAEAAHSKEVAEEARQSLDRERVALVAERDDVLEKAAVEAAREREALLEKARREAQALEAETREQMARERAAFHATVIAEAAQLAIEIAHRLVASAQLAAKIDPFLERAGATIAAMTDAERNRLLLPGESLILVSAVPLDERQRAAATAQLSRALGRALTLSFVDSVDLIAGIELRFPRAVLRHNWRDDLASALKDLTSDERLTANS